MKQWLIDQITKNGKIIKDGTIEFTKKNAPKVKDAGISVVKGATETIKNLRKPKTKTRRRHLKVHMGDQHIMNIVIDPATKEVSFQPKNGRVLIDKKQVQFGKSRPTVLIKL